MTTRLDRSVGALRARVEQVAAYQQVFASTDEIAHFTNWEACNAMFERADQGIRLWASDADCLNDSLEGKELLLFAEHTARLAQVPSTAPDWATGKWGRQAWERPSFADADHEDLPHLPKDRWDRLQDLLKELYVPPPLTVVRTAPRPERLTGSGVYLVSFCRDVDRLDLWRAYTKEASGVCLVMPLQAALHLTTADWRFFRVAYDDRSKARAWALLTSPLERAVDAANAGPDPAAGHDRIRRALAPALYLFKNEQFRAEREIRLVYSGRSAPTVLVRNGNGGTYVETTPFFLRDAASRAILGPKAPDPHHRAAVLRTRYKVMTGDAGFRVERSAVSFV